MAIKYKQRIKNENIGMGKLLLAIIIFMIVVNGVIGILNNMENARLAGYLSIGIILFMVWVNWKIINHYLAEYEYILNHDSLRINRIVGKRTKEKLNIPIGDIDYMVSIDQWKRDKGIHRRVKKNYNVTVGMFSKENLYKGYFQEKNKNYGFLFQPDKKMLEMLQKQLGDKKIQI